ncbi:MAG TPA: hypothetical protein VD790_03970 [Thermoleophilaceae bacterium]|nr:hypothetical protein [Thermoleophilaceae bacterium]
MRQPKLFESHGPVLQIVLAIFVPALFGIVTGVVLGLSEIGYLVLAVPIGIGGGYFAGKEHLGAAEGAMRGFTGGILFGTFILAADAATGMERKAHLPEPDALLVVLTTGFGVALGALGGRSRQRAETRLSSSTAPSSPPSS